MFGSLDEGRWRRFHVQVFVTFLAQGLNLLLRMASVAIVARWLGPEGKGVLVLALLVPGMLGLFLDMGVSVSNVYFAGSGKMEVRRLLASSIGLGLASTAFGLVLVAVCIRAGLLGRLVPGVPAEFLALAMANLPISLLSGYLLAVLQGLGRIVTVNIVRLIQGITMLIFTILLVVTFGFGLGGALVAWLLGGLGCLSGAVFALRKEGASFKPAWDVGAVGKLLSFGLKGYVANILQFFNYRLDMFLVNCFLGPASVGIYSVAVKLGEMLWYLPSAVGFVIFPKAASTDADEMNTFTPKVFRATLALTAAGALALGVVGRPLIGFVFSDAFLPSYGPMLVLLPGVVLLGASKVLTNEITGRGYPHYNSINAGVALVLTVILDLLLIPRYGISGAALASSVAYSVILFVAIGFYIAVSGSKVRTLLLPVKG
ncbi:MAG: hypothetical protein DRP94_03110 [Candidatus Latescibacterota bacterium]|nr:MAG: hypothetical protein DRP94_03110 [Candidatus Latescibacterota bacterium]RKY73546.1 MAG: hypothetical protein DRQ14_03950 [Candidatus Latescibacterota bacterium]